MSLTENPHLQSLLGKTDLQLYHQEKDAYLDRDGFDKKVSIGTVLPEGTIAGFYHSNKAQTNYAVVYDESKEGRDDALTLLVIHLWRPGDAGF